MLKRNNHRLDHQQHFNFDFINRDLKTFPEIQYAIPFLQQQVSTLKSYPYLHRHALMNSYHQWYDLQRFTTSSSNFIPKFNLTIAIQNYLLHQPVERWGSASEFDQDGLILLRLIAFYAAHQTNTWIKPRLQKTKVNWNMFVRMTHQHPRSLAAAFLWSYWIETIRKLNKNQLLKNPKHYFRTVVIDSIDALEKDSSLASQTPYFAQLFRSRKTNQLNLESMEPDALKNHHYVVDNLIAVVYIILKRSSHSQMKQFLLSHFSNQGVIVITTLYLEQLLYQ